MQTNSFDFVVRMKQRERLDRSHRGQQPIHKLKAIVIICHQEQRRKSVSLSKIFTLARACCCLVYAIPHYSSRARDMLLSSVARLKTRGLGWHLRGYALIIRSVTSEIRLIEGPA